MSPRFVLIAAVLTAATTACSGSSTPTAQPPPSPTETPTETATATVTPSAEPTTSSPSPSPTSNVPGKTDFGYVQSVDHISGVGYLQFDRALFLVGDAANQAAADHGDETPVPNDYYIVNDNPTIYTYELAADVTLREGVVLQGSDGYVGHPITGPLDDLEQFIKDNPKTAKDVPFTVHFDADQHVDKITEYFVP